MEMELKLGLIHIEKQEIWDPLGVAKAHREALNEIVARELGWHCCITPQERSELWNDGKGTDHPNVIEGEYHVVVDQTGSRDDHRRA
jgi:hypothetical protein